MADEKKTEAIATTGQTAMVQAASQTLGPAPDYIPKSRRGFEDTLQTDILIPRLALAQAMSPQATEGHSDQIPGLKPGELFNSVTGQIYGKSVIVQVLRKMPLRAMEFRSMDDGGGVIDPNVLMGDPRLKWGTSGDKKKDMPVATLFRDFLAVILPQREMIALSFKSSGIAAAKSLWGQATMSNRDCFAVTFKISTSLKQTPKPHQIYKIDLNSWASEADLKFGEEMYEAVQQIDAAKIHADITGDDPDDFTPAAYEAEKPEM